MYRNVILMGAGVATLGAGVAVAASGIGGDITSEKSKRTIAVTIDLARCTVLTADVRSCPVLARDGAIRLRGAVPRPEAQWKVVAGSGALADATGTVTARSADARHVRVDGEIRVRALAVRHSASTAGQAP